MKTVQPPPSMLLRGLLAVSLALGATAEAADTGAVEEILIVGSRIQKPDYAFSNPVQSVDADTIQVSGTTNIAEFLREYPALVGSINSNDAVGPNTFIGGTGLTMLNLRNLGTDRTLVLVDGRRHVGGLPGSAAVDIDTIPIDMIERVEILTGGASAVYGADGVSGVVNFVLKDDFEGVSFDARTGQSAEGDSQTYLLNGTAGTELFDGRGHGILAVEYSREEGIHAKDRDFAGGGDRKVFVSNPFAETPNEVPLGDIRYFDSSPEGWVDTNFDFGPDFNGTDTPWDFGTIDFISPFYAQGGDGTPVDTYIGDLTPDEERVTVNGFFTYDLTDKASFFSELKYSRNESFGRSQPTFDFFLFMEPDYAYYPSNIADALAESGTPALVSRDHFDLGVRGEEIERETTRGVLGLEGDFTDSVRYEVSLVYGRTEVTNSAEHNRYNDRFAAALDAVVDPDTGEVVCRSNLDPDFEPFNLEWQGWKYDYFPDWQPGDPWAGSFTPGADSGCVPLNILGSGVASREALAWIMTNSESDSELEQTVASAFISGDSEEWFSLPAGPVGFAVGVEWREEKSESNPAPEDRAGLTFGNKIEPVDGDFDVREAYAEISVPLLSDLPAVQELTFDAAFRVSDYSTIGNAETWKLGLAWQPVEDVVVRGTLAEATRAPNIGELFDPGGQTFQEIADPCDQNEVDNGTEFRAANCIALLTSLGLSVEDAENFTDPNSAFVAGTLVGNEELTEEVADTRTLGLILTPRFAPGLTVTLDWYDIELEDAINTALPEEAAQTCVDLPTLDNQFCPLVTREPGAGGIVDFLQKPLNVAEFTTEGYDFTVAYAIDPAEWGVARDVGLFNVSLVGNHLKELEFVNLPGAAPDDDLGEAYAPEWQYKFDVAWEYGGLLVNYTFSWFDETHRYSNEELAANPDIAASKYHDYREKRLHDMYVAYDLQETTRLYAGVNNLTDEEPDLGQTYYPVSAIGRFFFFGVEMQFGM
jgi:iron complex outermembrane receptor protein